MLVAKGQCINVQISVHTPGGHEASAGFVVETALFADHVATSVAPHHKRRVSSSRNINLEAERRMLAAFPKLNVALYKASNTLREIPKDQCSREHETTIYRCTTRRCHKKPSTLHGSCIRKHVINVEVTPQC